MVFELPPMGPKVGIYTISPDIKKLSLGNKKLDIFLEGGLNIRSNNLIISPPGEEKIVFGLQFINEGLKNGEPGIFITTNYLPLEIEKIAEKYNWNFKSNENINLLKFIDCYSWTVGKTIDINRKDIFIQGPNALNDLSIALSEVVSSLSKPNKPIRVCISSLSSFLLYVEKDTLFKFLQVIGAKFKTMGATSLFLLDEGMHDEKTITTLKHLSDEIIYLKKENKQLFLDKDSLTEKIKIQLTEKGLIVL
ncbi:MAG: RAD55 family ATPase [Candidatus Micrarchaeia archaeon]|jgi:KaiC/GvpD/RAD55 family RecA-like ATPase